MRNYMMVLNDSNQRHGATPGAMERILERLLDRLLDSLLLAAF